MPKKMMFARLDFSTFLICCSGDFSDNKSDEKPSVAICGGSICILTGLLIIFVSACKGNPKHPMLKPDVKPFTRYLDRPAS